MAAAVVAVVVVAAVVAAAVVVVVSVAADVEGSLRAEGFALQWHFYHSGGPWLLTCKNAKIVMRVEPLILTPEVCGSNPINNTDRDTLSLHHG